jgi:hypothetical protein
VTKNKVFIFIAVLCVGILSSVYVVTNAVSENKSLFVLVGKPSTEKAAYIKQVIIEKETCDRVTYRIDYYSTNKSKGFMRLAASSKVDDGNYDGFRSAHTPDLLVGVQSVTFDEWITDERESAQTSSLWVSIEEIVDKRFHGITDRIKIPFVKTWDHRCGTVR